MCSYSWCCAAALSYSFYWLAGGRRRRTRKRRRGWRQKDGRRRRRQRQRSHRKRVTRKWIHSHTPPDSHSQLQRIPTGRRPPQRPQPFSQNPHCWPRVQQTHPLGRGSKGASLPARTKARAWKEGAKLYPRRDGETSPSKGVWQQWRRCPSNGKTRRRKECGRRRPVQQCPQVDPCRRVRRHNLLHPHRLVCRVLVAELRDEPTPILMGLHKGSHPHCHRRVVGVFREGALLALLARTIRFGGRNRRRGLHYRGF